MGDVARLPVDLEARLETLGEAIDAVPSVLFAYLFGSAATRQLRPSSDVDVAVYVDPGSDPLEVRLAVFGAVSRHLGTDRLDVIVLNSAPLALAGRVLETRRIILDHDPFARHRYESAVIRAFADFRLRERRHFARRHRG